MYVKRNELGDITAISRTAERGFDAIDEQAEELRQFLARLPQPANNRHKKLLTTDAELARVLEDLIDLLTDKGLIQFTELPSAAQEKLLKRKSIRTDAPLLNLINEQGDDSILL